MFPYTKDKVKDAPRVDADQHLDAEHEEELYRYYGVTYADDDSAGDAAANRRDSQQGRDTTAGTAAAGTAAAGTAAAGRHDADRRDGDRRDGDRDPDRDSLRDRETAYDRDAVRDHDAVRERDAVQDRDAVHEDDQVPNTGHDAVPEQHERPVAGDGRDRGVVGTQLPDDGVVTRHEERIDIGTEQRVSGKVRLRKYITTEERTITVPVTREEIVVERVPVDEDTPVASDGYQGTGPELTLREEVPVVSNEPQPQTQGLDPRAQDPRDAQTQGLDPRDPRAQGLDPRAQDPRDPQARDPRDRDIR